MSAPDTTETEALADGPECDTCGKPTCPDAQLPAFSEPRDCVFKPIYEAIRNSKDCDYGCSRDYTNQTVTLWMVPAIEALLATRDAAQRAAGAETALREAEREMPQFARVDAARLWLRERADRIGGAS